MADRMGAVAKIELNVREIKSVPARNEPATDTRCFCIRWFGSNDRGGNNTQGAVDAR